MAFSIAELTELRDKAQEAYLKALEAESYSINLGGTSRNLKRQNIDTLKDQMEYWEQQLSKAISGTRGIPTRFITPVK